MRGLLRGLPASLMGIVPYSGTDLAIFYTLRARWMAANPDSKVRLFHDICKKKIKHVSCEFGQFDGRCSSLQAA